MDWFKCLARALSALGAREVATPDVSLWVLPAAQVRTLGRCRFCGWECGGSCGGG